MELTSNSDPNCLSCGYCQGSTDRGAWGGFVCVFACFGSSGYAEKMLVAHAVGVLPKHCAIRFELHRTKESICIVQA